MQAALAVDMNFSILSNIDLFKASASRWVERHHHCFAVKSKPLLHTVFMVFSLRRFNKIKMTWRTYVELESNKRWVSPQQTPYSLEACLSREASLTPEGSKRKTSSGSSCLHISDPATVCCSLLTPSLVLLDVCGVGVAGQVASGPLEA